MRKLLQASGVTGFDAFWRRLVVALTLLAFTQAGYVTQTHIHVAAATSGDVRSAQAGHGKTQVPDDPAHCPFCQEYLHAGAYVIPAPIVLPQPSAAAFATYRILHVLPFIGALSHSWHGRAPPLS